MTRRPVFALLSLLSCASPPNPVATRSPSRQPQPASPGPCPEGMALVERFCIDRWEASLVDMTGGVEAPFSPYESPEGRRVRAVSAPGVVPQGYISRDQAEQACREAGKRLCREQEWARACSGASGRTFPYGATRSPGVCNDSGSSPLRALYAGSRDAYTSGPMNDPRLNQQPGTVARTGEFSGCASESGVYDMVGNLHEWVMSPRPTFRGGYYLDTHLNGDGCGYRTTAHAAFYHDYSTGFRCCADARQ